jgi:hypothetical protein
MKKSQFRERLHFGNTSIKFTTIVPQLENIGCNPFMMDGFFLQEWWWVRSIIPGFNPFFKSRTVKAIIRGSLFQLSEIKIEDFQFIKLL